MNTVCPRLLNMGAGGALVFVCGLVSGPKPYLTKNSPELGSGEYPANAVPALL